MAMIDSPARQAGAQGRLTIVMPDGKTRTFGPGGGERSTVRITDRKARVRPRAQSAAGGRRDLYGRPADIEDGTILDLLELIVGANRWEEGGKGRKALGKGK